MTKINLIRRVKKHNYFQLYNELDWYTKKAWNYVPVLQVIQNIS